MSTNAAIRSDLRRKLPRQERARARVDRILDAAEALIAGQGVGALTLTGVAETAGVPIGSVYQYFGGQPALLRALAERHMTRFAAQLEATVVQRSARDNAAEVIDDLFEAYLRFYREADVYRQVRNACQGDPLLRELDLQDSRDNARRLAPLFPATAGEDYTSLLFLCCELAGTVAGLLLELNVQGADTAQQQDLKQHFKAMLRGYLTGLR